MRTPTHRQRLKSSLIRQSVVVLACVLACLLVYLLVRLIAGPAWLAPAPIPAATQAAVPTASEVPLGLVPKGERLSIGKRTPNPGFPLDNLKREIAPHGKPHCPHVPMVRYKGDIIRYHSALYIYVHFRARLKLFEQVVKQTALDVYGRAPRQIRHIGTYNCRRIAAYPTLLSEHGVGNGIDVTGFDFGRAPRAKKGPAGAGELGAVASTLPRELKRAFRVRILKHWYAKSGVAYSHHRRFLRLLAARLVQRRDIFRVLLGPGDPAHKNHFHFDVAPYRLVNL